MKDDKLQFGKKESSSKVIAALITGGASLTMYLVFILYRGIKEETPEIFAILSTLALVVTFIGFLVSIKYARKPQSSYKLPFISVIVNGLGFMIFLVTYALGLL